MSTNILYLTNESLGKPLSRLSFGGASISGEGGGYGFGAMSEKEAEKLLKSAWDHEINFFDTAPIYGFGLSEERMGKYLPKDAVIVSKGGVDWHDNRRVNMSNDPKVIERMLHESLKRLKREIDVYMIHWPDSKVDIRKPVEVLLRAKEQGHIKSIGLCNTTPSDLKYAQEITEIDFLQSEVNVFKQSFNDLYDDWNKKFTMSWGTLDKGILSGRVTENRKFSSEDCRSWAPWWNKKEVREKILRVNSLKNILDEEEINLSRFCLNFNINFVGVSSCLVGFKTEDDIKELAHALQDPLSREKIEEVLKRWG